MPDRLDGNEAQNRAVARQLFSAWENEQERKIGKWGTALPAWIACVLSIGVLIWNAAVISGEVAENTRRIEQIERERRQEAGDNRLMIERMARIEAKVDLILEAK